MSAGKIVYIIGSGEDLHLNCNIAYKLKVCGKWVEGNIRKFWKEKCIKLYIFQKLITFDIDMHLLVMKS